MPPDPRYIGVEKDVGVQNDKMLNELYVKSVADVSCVVVFHCVSAVKRLWTAWLMLCNLSRGVYSDTTQLDSTDPVEHRTAKSVVFLFMTSRPTNWVNCCSRCRVEFSWVELCRYKHPFSDVRSYEINASTSIDGRYSLSGFYHWCDLNWLWCVRACVYVTSVHCCESSRRSSHLLFAWIACCSFGKDATISSYMS